MLYICPTPIGNLEDVSLRVLSVLKQADLIACEDTRHTRILLQRYGITTKSMSFHEHNEDERLRTVLPLLREGRDVALVSDAGMPTLSDPGFTLVRACAEEGLPVTVLPGPSAVTTALVIAGLPSDRFAFVGYLARGKKQLLDQIGAFDGTGAAVVAFESPRRLRTTLTLVASRWPQRRLAVCRELTKMHEEVLRGTAVEVGDLLPETVRGEIVLVLQPSMEREFRASGVVATATTGMASGPSDMGGGSLEDRTRATLVELIRLGVGTKKAAAVVSQLTGMPGRRAYGLALEAKEAGSSSIASSRRRGGVPHDLEIGS